MSLPDDDDDSSVSKSADGDALLRFRLNKGGFINAFLRTMKPKLKAIFVHMQSEALRNGGF